MDAAQLKQIQDPVKAQYRAVPETAKVTFRRVGKVDVSRLVCETETMNTFESGLHPAAGGPGVFACSAELFLDSLIACAGVTLAAVATALSIPIGEAEVIAEGDVDFRGTLGVDKTVPVGFQGIRLHIHIGMESGATSEQIANLLRLTERYCVIYQTLSRSTPIYTDIAAKTIE